PERAGGERPWSADSGPWAIATRRDAINGSVTPPLDRYRKRRYRPEDPETERQSRRRAELNDQRNRLERRRLLPESDVTQSKDRPCDKGGKRDRHAHASTACGVQRAGRTAAPKLHADPEEKRADNHGNCDRRHG